ncbi:MAG: HAD-IIIA family hydrolase [Deltaproteobacteria bacterium]|nr:HAD-IIIA family hydrolase [Deltaproteobacteria bacterium]MBW2070503.1 HAD-IIIA family hydrolase [Deltaproteobacteria bacterium]
MKYLVGEQEVAARAARVRLLLLDVDGVLTDGTLFIHHDGRESKMFHAHDGLAIRLLQEGGIEVGILSGRRSEVVASRAEELGIRLVAQGTLYKTAAYEEMLQRCGLLEAEVAYVGDDLVDVPVLKRVGLAVAVANAAPEVISCCHLLTSRPGGRGAVRQVAELLLRAQDLWQRVTAPFLGQSPG